MPAKEQNEIRRLRKPETDDDLERVALAWAARNRALRIEREWRSHASSTLFCEVDPTRGATRYHRHDEAPGWARRLCPVALIGAYLFYID